MAVWPHVYTLAIVMIGWVFFRADTLPGAIAFLRAMAGMTAAAPTPYTVGWYLTPELWLALVRRRDRIDALGAGAGRAVRRRAASWSLPLLNTAALLTLLVAVDHEHGGPHLQPVHLFPVLMDTQAGTTLARDLLLRSLFLAAIIAAAGGEPRRRRRRRSRAPRIASWRHFRASTDRWRRSPALPAGVRRLVRRSFRLPIAAGPLVRREPAVRAAACRRRRRSSKGEDGWFFYGDDKCDRGLRQRRADDRRGAGELARGDPARARLAARARHRLRLHHRARQARRSTPRRCRPTLARVGDCRAPISCSRRCRTPGSPWTCAPRVFEAKTRERVYQQTDTHWNDRGALVAYQQIIEAVRARVPRDAAGLDARRFRRRSIAPSRDWTWPA